MHSINMLLLLVLLRRQTAAAEWKTLEGSGQQLGLLQGMMLDVSSQRNSKLLHSKTAAGTR